MKKQMRKRTDWRGVIVAVGGGAALMFLTVTLLAKPAPRVAGLAPRGAAPQPAAARRPAVAADPGVRELFRPLVGKRGARAPMPRSTQPPPVLPTIAPPAAPAVTTPEKPAPVVEARPTGPQSDDI